MLKRLLTVQDISCVGKISLGAALPVISALGVECSVLPTAVLSTHTDGFGHPAIFRLDRFMEDAAKHWETLGLKFDAFYSGYLGSIAQIRLVESLIERFTVEGAPVVIDPAMADGGRLYSGFDDDFVAGMRELCSHANAVLPNITEAALLTGTEYDSDGDEDYIRRLLDGLASLGARNIVLTGVTRGDEIGAAIFDAASGEYSFCLAKREPASFHGTGDLFASVTAAALARGRTLREAAELAVRFTSECVKASLGLPAERRYAAAFESSLGILTRESERWSDDAAHARSD